MRYYAHDLHIARAVAAERDGQPRQALAHLLAIFDPKSTGEVKEVSPESQLRLPQMVRLALAVDDQPTATAAAQAATEACAAHASAQLPTPPKQAAAEHCGGLLAADPAPLLAAAHTFHQTGMPLFRAHALEDAAVLFAQRGDVKDARATHAQAAGVYTDLGAAWDLRRADTRLRPYGVRRGRGSSRAKAATGWDALSPAELAVAKLVATGRSNPDIAAELFLSRWTVQTQVSRILTKLGARSRAEIIHEATRHQPHPTRSPDPATGT